MSAHRLVIVRGRTRIKAVAPEQPHPVAWMQQHRGPARSAKLAPMPQAQYAGSGPLRRRPDKRRATEFLW